MSAFVRPSTTFISNRSSGNRLVSNRRPGGTIACKRRSAVLKAVSTQPGKTFEEKLATLPFEEGSIIEMMAFRALGIRSTRDDKVVVNRDGKRASFRIFASTVRKFGGQMNRDAALEALEIYGEKVDDAKASPGAHPNIELLQRIVDEDLKYICKIDGKYVRS